MRTFLLCFLIAAAAYGQSAFDVASIRLSHPVAGEGGRRENVRFSPDSLTMRNVSLKAAVAWAWHVFEYQVQGPGWLNSDRWDVAAKAGGAVSEDQLRLMLEALLADRFKLEVHRQTKEMQAYLLSLGKSGPKFHESDTEGEMLMQPDKERMSVTVRRAPVSRLTEMLSTILQTPVLDLTGLTGRYDLTVNVAKYVDDLKPANGIPDVVSILTGLQEELGLKMESRKVPIDLVVVDHVERIPADN
jgi:uncharacterized protein (TIGR03435 family)